MTFAMVSIEIANTNTLLWTDILLRARIINMTADSRLVLCCDIEILIVNMNRLKLGEN